MFARALAVVTAAACLAGLYGGRAGAADGVIEINQTAVLAGGITPGDDPGFPATLNLPGSYRLTGNLDVRQSDTPRNVTAITVTANNVTIDLNGFAILGPCTGFPCSPSGAGNGIDGSAQTEVVVLNGTIQGMGNDGIILGSQARVERVISTNNGGDGVVIGNAGSIQACIVQRNTNDGIFAFGAAVVSGNTAVGNAADGIETGPNSVVTGNVTSANAGVGLRLAGGTGYGNNAINGNTAGTVQLGVQIGQNVCNGATCP